MSPAKMKQQDDECDVTRAKEQNGIKLNNQTAEEETDTTSCPICLEHMSKSDLLHPIHPPSSSNNNNNNDCQYNFCSSCIQSLITSSQSDYEEASDGNLAVKVKLVCPNCRVGISSTIHDILDLRKKEASKVYWSVPDCELSAKELQMKYMYTQNDDNDDKSNIDKKGKDVQEDIKVDTSLFAGLEYAMTHEEQLYIYTLLISAKPELLNMGAQLLSNIAEMSLKGITPSMRSGNSNNKPKPSSPPGSTARGNTKTTSSALRTGFSGTAGVQGAQAHARKKTTVAKYERLKLLNPLPTRMPKYINLPIQILYNVKDVKKCALSFVEDTMKWNRRNVLDAYSRVAIRRRTNREKKEEISVVRTLPPVPRGMPKPSYLDEILGDDGGLLENQNNRVLIANIRGIAARSGLQVGDVVTHVNGEAFEGNVEELCNSLQFIYEEENRSGGKSVRSGGGDKEGFFNITVNADLCTAYAIHLRAARMKEGL